MTTLLGEVIALVSDAFKGDTDKGGRPYVLHCFAVMENARHFGFTDDTTLAAAFAHDLLEDKPDRATEFYRIAMRYENPDVIKLVRLLTKGEREQYGDFIKRIIDSGDPRAIAIKKADLKHNSCITRLKGITESDLRRMKKYHESFLKLDSVK